MANIGKIDFMFVNHNGKIWKIAPGQFKHYNRAFKRGRNPKISDYAREMGRYCGELHPKNCANCNCVNDNEKDHRDQS